MQLTEKEVQYVADLANLALTKQEVGQMAHDLAGILEQMDRLAEIDTGDIAPMAQVLYEEGETGSLRPDVERAPLGNQLALAGAALSGAGYFKVPLVIER